MVTATSNFNPYQAPGTPISDASLAPDTEFLFNDKVVNDWTEEAGRQPGKDFTRILSSGTFALQAHDPKSVVKYKNIQVRRLD